MTQAKVGPLMILVADRSGREERVVGIDNEEHDAWVTPALVVGPGELLLEVSARMWVGGGEIVADSRGDSHPHFQRLVQGCRLGVKENSSGSGTAMVGAVKWDFERKWANVSKASESDLDQMLGSSARDALIKAGVTELQTRAELWGDESPKKFYLEAQFAPDEPAIPLILHALTRVLPVVRAIESGA